MSAPLYPPLQLKDEESTIRLVELVLDDKPEIQCSFHIRSIRDQSPYIALSYTWGELLPRKHIYLNGHEFPVRSNLYEALLAIRKRLKETAECRKQKQKTSPFDALHKLSFNRNPKQSFSKYGKFGTPYFPEQVQDDSPITLLWVDQLCINQNDVEERNSQVQLMSRIYSCARIVLVWLGTHPKPEAVHGMIACLEATNAAIVQKKKPKYYSRPTTDQRKSMQEMASNPYWTRVWIVQEIMLARTALVQLANTVFEYQELLPLLLKGPGNIEMNSTFAYSNFSNWTIESTSMGQLLWLRSTLHDLEKDKGDVSVHMLLTMMRNQKCSDGRDKVYGLLGLIKRGGLQAKSDTLWADYSLSGEEIYKMVLLDASKAKFADASSALDLCCKAGEALDVNWKDDRVVNATADLLVRVVGTSPWVWSAKRAEVSLEEIRDRIRNCRWTMRLNDIVSEIMPPIGREIERGKRGY